MEMRTRTSAPLRAAAIASLIVLAAGGCRDREADCRECDTVVIAATGEPSVLLPPLVYESVGRDISDLLFERLVSLKPGGVPIDTSAYRPGLAAAWSRVDSVTWRFRLRPGARWHDGHPVTASDVVFSFAAYADSTVDALARSYVAGRVTATAEDSATVLVRFKEPGPDQLYDVGYHVRIIPRHIWEPIPTSAWPADTSLAHLVGSGPFRLSGWTRGQFLTLVADSTASKRPDIRRLIWRFAPDADAALNLVLSHEADLLEVIGTPDRVGRVASDSGFRTISSPAANYGFLAFRYADKAGRPHPLLSQRTVRHALTEGLDRQGLAGALLGPGSRVPPGPMSQLLWIWSDSIRALPFDTAAARRLLEGERAGREPKIDILVPVTSPARRMFAVAIQAAWRKIGVASTVTAVDFPVFQERLAQGRFDTYIGAYLDEPSPRGLADQWSRSGWGMLNYGRYANASFDSLLTAAGAESDVATAGRLWREAMDTLNADAAAIFLYAPVNVAAVNRRLGNVTIDPYSWLSTLPDWEVSGERQPSAVSSR
jgi:peptide/nickel transport system substrate-binding protein